MRDLAHQSSSYKKRSLKTSPKVIKIAVVVLVVGGIYFLSSKANVGGESIGGDGSTVRNAPAGLVPVKVDGAPVDTSSGSQLASGTINLKNVAGSLGGTATAGRVFGAGTYTLTVNATLPNPKGDRYQAWLSDGENAYDANFMEGSGTTWSTTFRNTEKYANFKQVWITREITTEDNKPEKHIMEGTF